MTIYYKKNDKGNISEYTTSKDIADSLGYEFETSEKILRSNNGKLYLEKDFVDEEPTDEQKRAAEMPTTEEQLKMMYFDRVNKTDVWFETLQAIYKKYPEK